MATPNIQFNVHTPTFNNFNKISFFMFAIIGVIIKTFFFNDYSQDGLTGPANANLWGYGIISFALLGLLFVSYSDLSSDGGINYVKSIFQASIPGFILLLILYWLIMLNMNYYTKINKGEISQEFKLYSFVSSFVIFLQLYVVYKFLDKKTDKKTPFKLLSYLLTLANVILIGIMTIILTFFSTDG